MKHQQFDDTTLDTAWKQVERNIRSSGLKSPAPGFNQRWQARLAKHKDATKRKEVWLMVGVSLIVALGFLGFLSLQTIPSLSRQDGFLSFFVNLFANMIVFVNMIGSIFETLFRTLPRVLPISFQVSVIGSLFMLFILWVSMMRRYVQNQGVQV